MGAFNDKAVADYYGIAIVVEGSAKMSGGSFSLYVDNEKRDAVEMLLGTRTMRTKISRDGRELPLEVDVKQGMFGSKFALRIDGREHPLQRVK